MYNTKKTFTDNQIVSNIEDIVSLKGSVVFERGSSLILKGGFKIYHPGVTDDNSHSEVITNTVLSKPELSTLKRNNSLETKSFYFFEDIYFGKKAWFLLQAITNDSFAPDSLLFLEKEEGLSTFAVKYNFDTNYVSSLTDERNNKIILSEQSYTELVINGGGLYVHPFEVLPWDNIDFYGNTFEETVFYNAYIPVFSENHHPFKGNKFVNSKLSFQLIGGPFTHNFVQSSSLRNTGFQVSFKNNEVHNTSVTAYIFEKEVEKNTFTNITLDNGTSEQILESRIITAADSNYTTSLPDNYSSVLQLENLLAYANKIVWENTSLTSASRVIKKISNSTNDNREYYILVKTAHENTTLTIKHQDDSEGIENMVDCMGGTDIVLQNGDVLQLIYNDVKNRFLAFNPGKGGFGGSSAITIIKENHGFVFGDVVNSALMKAMADNEENAEVLGVVSKVIDGETFELTTSGKMDITGLGLQTNTTYFLSPDVPGVMQPVDVITPTFVSKPILVAISPNTAVILNHRGMVIMEEGGFAIPVFYPNREYFAGNDVKIYNGVKWSVYTRNTTPYPKDVNGDNILVSPLDPDGDTYWLSLNGSLEELGAEPAFAKNSGFNLPLGTTAGTVSEGNHHHDEVYLPLNHDASGVSNIKINNWDSAFGWGDHAAVGYLTSFTETDPFFNASPSKNISASQIDNWDTAFTWGNHAGLYSFLGHTHNYDNYQNWKLKTNGIQRTSIGSGASLDLNAGNNITISYGAGGVVTINSTYTDTIYNHPVKAWVDKSSLSGALVISNLSIDGGGHPVNWTTRTLTASDINALPVSHAAAGITGTKITNWDTAFEWGNHATAGYLKTFTETDPFFRGSPAFNISSSQIINWDTAFGWGNHATAGYLKSTDGGTTGGTSNVKQFIKNAHNFKVGNPVNNLLGLANANDLEAAEFIGFVTRIIDDNTFEVAAPGSWLDISTWGLTGPAEYFLSTDPAKPLTTIVPQSPYVRKPVLVTVTSSVGLVVKMLGISGNLSGGGGGNYLSAIDSNNNTYFLPTKPVNSGPHTLATLSDLGNVGGTSNVQRINKVAHGFVIGDPVNNKTELASAVDLETSEFIGFVINVINADSFEIAAPGSWLDISTWGLSGPAEYFLTADQANPISTTPPVASMVRKPVLVTLSSSLGLVVKMLGLLGDITEQSVNNHKTSENIPVIGVTVGNYKDGDVIPAGTTWADIFKHMLTRQIPPVYNPPTLSLSISGSVLNVEAGTTLDLSETAVFTQHDGGICTGVSFKKANVEEYFDTAEPYSHDPAPYVIGDESITYQATASYQEGAIKNDNLNQPYPEGHILAGSVNSNTVILRGQRNAFFGVDNPDNLSASIRALAGKRLNPANGTTFTITVPVNSTKVTFSYPATLRNVTEVAYRELQNMDIKGSFTLSTDNVEGEGGFTAVSYKTYVYVPVEPFDQEVNFDITI